MHAQVVLTPRVLQAIVGQYSLPWRGTHGLPHWARVLENGLRIAEDTGADPAVVTLFAVFHDACRTNEGWDHGHGRRGADLAAQLRAAQLQLVKSSVRHPEFLHGLAGRSRAGAQAVPASHPAAMSRLK